MPELRLGLSGGLVPRDPADYTPELAARLAGLGVTSVVTHLLPPPEVIAAGPGRQVREVLAARGIEVVQATGYNPHLTSADDGLREAGLLRLRRAFDAAAALGSRMVISGCGSLHPTEFYGPSPRNHTQAARDRLVDSLRRAAPWAEAAGIPLALECHVLTTLDTPEHIRAVLDAVDSDHVGANFDPVNLLGTLPDVYASGSAMRRMRAVVGPRYLPCVHVKDVSVGTGLVVHIDEAPPGEGLLDMDALLAICAELPDGTSLVVEHLPAELAVPALQWLRERAAGAGITWVPAG